MVPHESILKEAAPAAARRLDLKEDLWTEYPPRFWVRQA